MHETQRWRLVCYDIRDAKRYRKAHKLLKGYGEPVQFSIFRCRLDDRQAAQLRWELAKILSEEDGLLILDLCPRCAGRVVTCNHKAGWDAPPPTFSVILSGSAAPVETDQAPSRAKKAAASQTVDTDGKTVL
jgi:CRISPR-associated protein Cas2